MRMLIALFPCNVHDALLTWHPTAARLEQIELGLVPGGAHVKEKTWFVQVPSDTADAGQAELISPELSKRLKAPPTMERARTPKIIRYAPSSLATTFPYLELVAPPAAIHMMKKTPDSAVSARGTTPVVTELFPL